MNKLSFHSFAVFKASRIIVIFTFLSVLVSCTEPDNTEHNKFDHYHDKAIDMEKHLFEHVFAEQCVAQKMMVVIDHKINSKKVEERCLCIASYLFKDMAVKESYRFLHDKRHALTLRNKYEAATKQCL